MRHAIADGVAVVDALEDLSGEGVETVKAGHAAPAKIVEQPLAVRGRRSSRWCAALVATVPRHIRDWFASLELRTMCGAMKLECGFLKL